MPGIRQTQCESQPHCIQKRNFVKKSTVNHLIRYALAASCLLAARVYAELPGVVADALQRQGVNADSVSVVVQQLDSTGAIPQPLVSHQADLALNPASTMKLLTTYAGLEILGPAYRWRTEMYRDGKLQNGVLSGNLIIKGHGDPSLMAEDFWRMLNSLRQAGVQQIRGDLILDNSDFAPLQTDPGSFDGEPYRAYNATADALAINLKSTSIKLVADAQSVSVTADPDLPEINIVNQLKAVQKDCGDWKSRLHYDVKRDSIKGGTEPSTQLVLTGEFSTLCGEKYLDMSLLSNQDYIANLFRKLWVQLGGSFSGKTRQGITPPAAVKILQQDSLTLADLIRRINKYSNNFMARQLLLTIAAESGSIPATEMDGDLAIHGWLAGKGMDFPELVVENGAGLSRIERISARHLNDLLVKAYASPVMPELMSSLPKLAVDGTTGLRLRESAAQGHAHLKTGSLDGVRSLAGYMLDQKGRRWAIVFITNGPRVSATRAAQDTLLEWVYAQP